MSISALRLEGLASDVERALRFVDTIPRTRDGRNAGTMWFDLQSSSDNLRWWYRDFAARSIEGLASIGVAEYLLFAKDSFFADFVAPAAKVARDLCPAALHLDDHAAIGAAIAKIDKLQKDLSDEVDKLTALVQRLYVDAGDVEDFLNS